MVKSDLQRERYPIHGLTSQVAAKAGDESLKQTDLTCMALSTR